MTEMILIGLQKAVDTIDHDIHCLGKSTHSDLTDCIGSFIEKTQ